jgi:hypothetical protein
MLKLVDDYLRKNTQAQLKGILYFFMNNLDTHKLFSI